MRIVVDTNIVFSAIINSNSRIGRILFDSHSDFEFFSPEFIEFEIQKHFTKLKQASSLSDDKVKVSI